MPRPKPRYLSSYCSPFRDGLTGKPILQIDRRKKCEGSMTPESIEFADKRGTGVPLPLFLRRCSKIFFGTELQFVADQRHAECCRINHLTCKTGRDVAS